MLDPHIIAQSMYAKDRYSQWLGIDILETRSGYCRAKMTVRLEMTNGFKIAHGGITYGLADSAFAFASNSEGQLAVSIETSISHTKAVQPHDIITAEAIVMSSSHKLAIYDVKVTNQKDEIVALFKGTVYKKSESWDTIIKNEDNPT